ncbi:hypothetical protein MKW92_049820 [Papaver armeniacum]|nr:hypothetical protein MKW92_049820 [Papaver armeniacum]
MAAATSSGSSAFENQTRCCTLDDIRQVMNTRRLRVPNEILKLLGKTVGWGNPGDLIRAREFYTNIRKGRRDPNFSIEKELEKLKGLASALGSKCHIYSKECGNLEREHEACCQRLAEELVEKAPRIKDMPGYKHLTSYDEKFRIEQALRNKAQKVEQVEDCAIHLEDFRREVRPIAGKLEEAYGQLGNVRRILRGVNEFIQILATTKQDRVTVDNSGRYDKKRKRNTLESQGNMSVEKSYEVMNVEVSQEVGNVSGRWGNVEVSQEVGERKEVDRKEVEESLLEVLKKVSG